MRRAALLAILLSLVSAFPASAREEIRLLSLTNFRGYVQGGYLNRHEQMRYADSDVDYEARYSRFLEVLQLWLDGSILHPKFCNFYLDGRLRMTQSRFEGDSGSHRYYSPLMPGGKIRLAFLEHNSHPINLWAGWVRSEVERIYEKDFEQDVREVGGSYAYREGQFPFSASAGRRLIEVFNGRLDYEQRENFADFNSRYHLAPRSFGLLSYSYNKTVKPLIDWDYTLHRASLDNITFLDDLETKQLVGALRFEDHADGIKQRSYAANETFSWRHNQRLSSDYGIDYRRDENDYARSNSYGGQVGVSHTLYRSLTSALRGYERRYDSDSMDIRSYGGQWSESYTRHPTSWFWFQITAIPNYDMTIQDSSADESWVLNERYVLTGDQPVAMTNPPSALTEVTLTDETGGMRYVLDVDYRLQQTEHVTYLVRMPTGAIPDGGAVLVDYPRAVGGDRKLRTVGIRGRLGLYFWDWLQLYANPENSRRKLISGVNGIDSGLTRKELYGLSAQFVHAGFRFEYEEFESPAQSYWAHTEIATASTPILWGWSLNGGATNRLQKSKREDFDYHTIQGSAGVNGPLLGTGSLFRTQANLFRERWNNSGVTTYYNGFGLESTLSYEFHQLYFDLGLEIKATEQAEVESDVTVASIKIRREF